MEYKPTNAGGENFYGDSPLTRTKIKFLFDKLFVVNNGYVNIKSMKFL